MPDYKISYRKRAAKEYIESIIWYQQHSFQAAQNFILITETAIKAMLVNPYSFKNIYKKFYEVKIKKFPLVLCIL